MLPPAQFTRIRGHTDLASAPEAEQPPLSHNSSPAGSSISAPRFEDNRRLAPRVVCSAAALRSDCSGVTRPSNLYPVKSPPPAFPFLLLPSSSDMADTHYSTAPTEYERGAYYNGITGNGDHPELVYRSDFLTTHFPRPVGRYAHIPVKSLHGVYDTPLNGVWETVGPKIVDLIITQKISWSSIDPARFFTHATPGEEEKGTLGPVVIWIGVSPGSTSSDVAHKVSQEILALLWEHQVEDTVVEWREAVLQRLAGPPLMGQVDIDDPTHYIRRFLTPLHCVPLATQGMEAEDAQGTLTLWFHENKDKDGNPSHKVYGVSNCHVLRKDTKVDYEHKGGAPKDFVRVCGERRFQRGVDEIKKQISNHSLRVSFYTQRIDGLKAKKDSNEENTSKIDMNQCKLNGEQEAIHQLEVLYEEVTKYWFDIKLHRNIGYVQHTAAIKVGAEGYTSDWGVFLAAEAKVKDQFEGNVVDLGLKYSPEDLMEMFYPHNSGATTFKFPPEGKIRIVGCATKEDLDNPTEHDSQGNRCFIVGKDGNTTDLTIGRYAGLVSFTHNEVGIVSIELGIYNSGIKNAEVFSAKGDSGSLLWHMKSGKAYIVGQLHSGGNKGGSTSNHVSYCTPGWYLLDQIKKRYPHADFYRTSW